MMNTPDADVLVIGAGPAGASVAIRLALQGWSVAVVEKSAFPRAKVCGECLGPASLHLLHELGVADRLQDLASPELREVGWMIRKRTIVADMPPCTGGSYRYGRAIGRDQLDLLLLERARELGVRVIQPARARRLQGPPGAYVCEYQSRSGTEGTLSRAAEESLSASVVIDAHGSWANGPAGDDAGSEPRSEQARSDLLGFKATFRESALPVGLLPVLSLPGGYGGMVVADRGRTTVACCLRRDVLREFRLGADFSSAGSAVDAFLRASCRGVARALDGAELEDGWRSIGPLRPGFHAANRQGVLLIGNAAAEAHPLIGEGICMALESAALLARLLGRKSAEVDAPFVQRVQQSYLRSLRATFARRVNLARWYAHIAMRRPLAAAVASLLQSSPRTLTWAAQLAGKARGGQACES